MIQQETVGTVYKTIKNQAPEYLTALSNRDSAMTGRTIRNANITLVQHEKAATFLDILKTFFSSFSSDTRQSMKRRIATERLSKIYIARYGYIWLDESKWPQEWPISPITTMYLKIPSEKMKSFCLHRTGF